MHSAHSIVESASIMLRFDRLVWIEDHIVLRFQYEDDALQFPNMIQFQSIQEEVKPHTVAVPEHPF